jgi:hypothetical protein
LRSAIHDKEKKLKSKQGTVALNKQTLIRHEAVLHLMRLTLRRGHVDSREEMSLKVANCFGKGAYFAQNIVQWEGTWVRDRDIETGSQGCFSKVQSWFNDEGVHLAVREYLAGAKEGNDTFQHD